MFVYILYYNLVIFLINMNLRHLSLHGYLFIGYFRYSVNLCFIDYSLFHLLMLLANDFKVTC